MDKLFLAVFALNENFPFQLFLPTKPIPMKFSLYRSSLLTIVSLGMLSLSPLAAETEAPNEHVLYSYKKAAPLLDGVISGDSAWDTTQAAVDFLTLTTGTPASNATEVRALWNDEGIVFGVTAHTPADYTPLSTHSEPSKNDNIEIWLRLRPDAEVWQQLIIDASGQTSAYISINGNASSTDFDFEAVTSSFKGGWSAEIAIPFASLGLTKPENNAVTGFAVHRIDHSVSPLELSSWASLKRFNETAKFPQLIFSSDWEISPELAYWNNGRANEKLLRRTQVSAAKILATDSPSTEAPKYTLWKYNVAPLTDERRKRHASLETMGLYGNDVYWSGYKNLKDVAPEFYEVAIGLNVALVALSKMEEQSLQLQRAEFYATQDTGEAQAGSPVSLTEVMDELDAIYNLYGSAFDNEWDVPALDGLAGRLATLQEKIASQAGALESRLTALQDRLQKKDPWTPANLRLAADEIPRDKSGTPNGIYHTLYAAFPFQEPIKILWDRWDSTNIDWTRTLPDSDGKGDFQFPLMTKYVDFIQKTSPPGMKVSYHMLFGSYYAMPFPGWLEQKAIEDPDMLLTSSDGLQVESRKVGPESKVLNDGMNINHPFIQEYASASVEALAKRFGKDTAYVVAGWEDNNILHIPGVSSGKGYRTVGYNPTGKAAFREYLAKRYKDIGELNAKWKTDYASYSVIEPPADKWLAPSSDASGLTYEWERFSRMNHLAYSRLLKAAYKKGSPDTPVMIDDSHFLANGNLYWVVKEDVADIYSYHWTPANEDAHWAFLDRLSNRFGKTMGYYENYYAMNSSRVMDDEIKSRAALREFFWRLYTRGNRYIAWWLTPTRSSTAYALAYGGGDFGLDFDGTIFRWSASILPVMFQRGENIEKALVGTLPEPTRAALLQPDASVLNLTARAMAISTGLPPLTNLIMLHNEFLAPGGFPVDFITEEMVLDDKASLSEFSTLIVANGYWMDPAFSTQLKKWVEDGGRLIAIGPFAMDSPWGTPLEKAQSAFQTAFDPVERTGKDLWSVKIPKIESVSPVIKTRPLGKGSIDYLTRSVEAFVSNGKKREQLNGLLADAIPRLAVSNSTSIKLTTRVAEDGTLFVFPVNVSLTDTVTATLSVKGNFESAQDCVIPNGVPLSLKKSEGTVDLDVQLSPGDWTVIRLTPDAE